MHGTAQEFRVAENHARRRSDDDIPPLSQQKIAQPIPLLRLPPGMVCSTVALDDDPAVYEQIHTADAVDLHLHLHRTAQVLEQQTRDALGARLGATVEERP